MEKVVEPEMLKSESLHRKCILFLENSRSNTIVVLNIRSVSESLHFGSVWFVFPQFWGETIRTAKSKSVWLPEERSRFWLQFIDLLRSEAESVLKLRHHLKTDSDPQTTCHYSRKENLVSSFFVKAVLFLSMLFSGTLINRSGLFRLPLMCHKCCKHVPAALMKHFLKAGSVQFSSCSVIVKDLKTGFPSLPHFLSMYNSLDHQHFFKIHKIFKLISEAPPFTSCGCRPFHPRKQTTSQLADLSTAS